MSSTTTRRLILLLVATLITVAVLAALLAQLQIAAVVAALDGVHRGWLAAAVVGALLLRTLQAAELLRHALLTFAIRLPLRAVLATVVGSLGIQAALPWGAGHAARVTYLARAHGAAAGRTAAATVVVVWLKLVLGGLLALVGWLLLPDAGPALGAFIGGVLVVALAAPLVAARIGRRLAAGTEATQPSRRREALAVIAHHLRLSALPVTAAHALIALLGNLVIFAVLVVAVGGPFEPIPILTYVPVAWLAARLPVTVHGVGTREVVVVMLLRGMAAPEILLAASLLYSAVSFLIPALLGSVATWPFVARILRRPRSDTAQS